MQDKQLILNYQQYDHDHELPLDEQQLVEAARGAAALAYAVYSNFQVGAALLLDNGQVVLGNNQENAAYPSGLCAERVAIFYANANYPEARVLKMAIAVRKQGQLIDAAIPPCGACRQVLLESEQRAQSPIRLILAGAGRGNIVPSAESLLPMSFSAKWL